MTAESLAYSWIRRGIPPLQKRVNPGYKYSGLNDPSRVLKIDFTHPKVMRRMRLFFCPTTEQPALFEEYSTESPPHEVGEPPSSFDIDNDLNENTIYVL
jgi:hypothetical protein